jgi:pimeloyl-ACP methyl ester carboxylesterase
MTHASCVSFPNRQGIRLAGMLHEPDPSCARNVCVLLLSPGIKGRVGPHRLYLKIAARLVPMGFHVLRFDFHGLGDSEGHLSERVLADVYNGIQSGRYVQDTMAAMDWLEKIRGINRFVASGLCGGSITGLLTAESDSRIRSVLALGMPVVLDGDPQQQERYITKGQMGQLRQGYIRKLFRPAAWTRFLTGRSSYNVIWRSFKRKAQTTGDGAGSTATYDNTNPRFAPAFFSLVGSGRPIKLIFSGADRLGWEFQEKFVERNVRRLEAFRLLVEVNTIENANHVFSDPGWIDQMLGISARWLDANYPPKSGRTATSQ